LNGSFALPFAYAGMILGSFETFQTWPTVGQFLWVTMAMVGARSAAMALNRMVVIIHFGIEQINRLKYYIVYS